MSRYVLTVNLKNDPAAIAAYRDHHRRVWPEVIESLRHAGVESMDIHLLGRRVVMIVELTDGRDFRHVFGSHRASSPRVAEWEELMKSLQEPSPDAAAGEWWAVMEPVFHLQDVGPAVARRQ
jgi:L-rhamnose mutarotase